MPTIDRGLVPPDREAPRHRASRAARVAPPPRSFRDQMWNEPRTPIMIGLGGLLGVLCGVSAATGDNVSGWLRGAGVLAIAGGLLAWLSYFLRFRPHLISGERWMRTRPRRLLRAVLVHAWLVLWAGALVGGLVYRVLR